MPAHPAPTAAPRPPRFAMRVTVRTEHGRVHEYDALFAHTFDAYEDAINRFADAARVVVKTIHSGARP